MQKKIVRIIGDNFLAGILVTLPILLTIIIIRFLVLYVNNLMLNPLLLRLKPFFVGEELRLFFAKVLIFIIVIIFIIVVGIMTRVIFVRRTFLFFEKFLYKLPMINKVYGVIKEISYAFLGNNKSSFQQVVLIEYPRKGVFTIGFVTSSRAAVSFIEAIGADDIVSVYVPTTPNPTSGLFIIVKECEIIPLDISVEDALKVVISAGVIKPVKKNKAMADSGNTKDRGSTSI